jgi:hypothetical protein
MRGSGGCTGPWVRRLDGLAAEEAGGQEAQRGSSGCGGGGSVPADVLRPRARKPSVAFITELKAVEKPCVSRLRSHGMGGGRRRRGQHVRRRRHWVAGVAT